MIEDEITNIEHENELEGNFLPDWHTTVGDCMYMLLLMQEILKPKGDVENE